MENARYKICPVIGMPCKAEKCAWWCKWADDCSIPLLAGMFADSEICRNTFENCEEHKNE